MKSAKKIAFAVLMIITLLAMFLPVAQFRENTAGALIEEIEKQPGKVSCMNNNPLAKNNGKAKNF